MQLTGLVDVDPQPTARADGVLVTSRRGPRGLGEEHLLAPVSVLGREREQRLPPLISAGPAAGQEVIGAPARRDPKPPVAPHPGGQFDQPFGLLVKQPHLQRPVALGRELTGEDAPVRQPDATAQPIAPVAGALRNAGGGRCGHLLLPVQVWPRPACAPVTP